MFSLLMCALTLAAQPSPSATPTWPAIDTEIGTVGGGSNDAAVIVGISAYYDLPRIDGARDNAEAWQQYLLRARKVPGQNIVTLLDRQGSKELITAAIADAARGVKPGGTLWFVFVGHGAPNRAGTDGLLLGADTLQNVESLSARGLAQGDVLKALSAGRQTETIVVFDACFSGKSGDGRDDLVAGLMATVPTRRTSALKKVTVLAASDSFAGPLPGTRRPAFSYLLLGGLRGWADDDGDHQVSLDETFSFARQTMQAVLHTSDRLPSQRGSPSSLVVPAKAPRPDIEALIAGRCPSGQGWTGERCERVQCPPGTSPGAAGCAPAGRDDDDARPAPPPPVRRGGKNDDVVVSEFPCSIMRGIEGVGGRCLLFSTRLRVEPHALNVQSHSEDIPLDDIVRVETFNALGFVPTGVRLQRRRGGTVDVIVGAGDRERIVSLIKAQLSK